MTTDSGVSKGRDLLADAADTALAFCGHGRWSVFVHMLIAQNALRINDCRRSMEQRVMLEQPRSEPCALGVRMEKVASS